LRSGLLKRGLRKGRGEGVVGFPTKGVTATLTWTGEELEKGGGEELKKGKGAIMGRFFPIGDGVGESSD
jgi:hypothetical protein